MTDDVMLDFITLLKTFDHTNVAGATIENLTADPTILSEYDYVKATDTQNANGYIVVQTAEEGSPDEFGPTRHENYFFKGFILYNSLTKLTSATIYSIKAEIRSLMNVNNIGINDYYYRFVSGTNFNGNPEQGVLEFAVEGSKIGVSAIA
ncbi:hypothetical protein KAR91_79975 [Candidatus Pacearchaeota archaeon]|nr:hypothetical protein [Candidatus Pacearchaeota archaeon]